MAWRRPAHAGRWLPLPEVQRSVILGGLLMVNLIRRAE